MHATNFRRVQKQRDKKNRSIFANMQPETHVAVQQAGGRTLDLFGGAVKACVPSSWRDVSRVRQVPGTSFTNIFSRASASVLALKSVINRFWPPLHKTHCIMFVDHQNESKRGTSKTTKKSSKIARKKRELY